MERDSLLYKTRRRLQVIAYKIFSKESLSKFYYKVVMHQKLNLDNPKTFNEKLQWMKLYYYPENQLVIDCSDKYKVREYIAQKGYEELLVPLLSYWESANDIEWDKLPEKFVLKCNHGCAYNILCHDKNTFDTDAAGKQLNKWMKEDFGAFNIETHYSQINPHIITCEEYLGSCITDYKFFCFNGDPKYIYVSTDLTHDRDASIGFFYPDGTKMPLTRDDYTDIESIQLPDFFEEMKNVASELSKDFNFVRVDFFLANDKYYFAELTFTPGACMMPFNPPEYDLEWGNLVDINQIKR